MFKQVFPNVYNVSGSHSYQHVPFLALVQTEGFDLFEAWEIVSIASFFLKFFCDHLRRHTQSICLAGSIDVGKDHMVGMCQGIYELRE